jgi:hypothetical protein
MRRVVTAAIVAAFVSSVLAGAEAQQPQPPSTPPSSPTQAPAPATLQDASTQLTRAANQMVAQKLAKMLGTLPNVLEDEYNTTKLGWGELVIATRLSQSTGIAFDEIVKEAKSGKTWDAVAQAHSADVARILADAKQTRAAIETAEAPRGEPQQQQQQQPTEKRHRRNR